MGCLRASGIVNDGIVFPKAGRTSGFGCAKPVPFLSGFPVWWGRGSCIYCGQLSLVLSGAALAAAWEWRFTSCGGALLGMIGA